jgi:hypothetical protein
LANSTEKLVHPLPGKKLMLILSILLALTTMLGLAFLIWWPYIIAIRFIYGIVSPIDEILKVFSKAAITHRQGKGQYR